MLYFVELPSYKTYEGKEDDLHFIYNANAGGGQSFLGGKFRDAGNNLVSPVALNGTIGVFCFSVTDESGNLHKIRLDSDDVKYEIKPRAAGDTNMKFSVGKKPNPSQVIAAFLMLPETCGVKNPDNVKMSPLGLRNYWLQSMWLTVDQSNGESVLNPRDCIFCGGINKDGQGQARYFSLKCQDRMSDVMRIAEAGVLDGNAALCVEYFSSVYKGVKPFDFTTAAENIANLMQELQDKHPDRYSGIMDPLPFLMNMLPKTETVKTMKKPEEIDAPRQKITYGAPGTGKSHGTEGLIEKYGIPSERVFRTTFHPDSDYSTFVGAYKPATDKGTQKIVYSFRPQAFMNAYVKAWEDVSKPVVLVIEEINRGHCAQIFGDLFQLLDRRDDGYSRYPITPDADLAAWLDGKVPDATTLKLPPNLYIWATMNTSDQSLFPMDSAFKRRWDWEYVPIAKPDKDDDANWRDRAILANGMYYDWWTFITIVNKHIAKTTQSEDKQLGYFFVKAPDDTGVIAADRFVNKVLFFLFNDAFKDWKLPEGVFGKGNNERYAFKDFFYCEKTNGHKSGDVREDVLAEFLDHLQWENEKLTASNDAPKTNGEKAQSAATAQPSAPAQTSSVGQAAVVNQSAASAE